MRTHCAIRMQLVLLTITGCLATLTGCGGETAESALAKNNETNIQRLSNLYFSFQMKNGWKGPKDEQDFKDFLNSYSPRKLQRIGIDPGAIDDLFVSSRDGQPFKVRFGVPGSAMGSTEPVIFESAGVDGKFLVGFLDMRTEEFDATESDRLFNAKPSKADPKAKRENTGREN